jgi:hypothetical protein
VDLYRHIDYSTNSIKNGRNMKYAGDVQVIYLLTVRVTDNKFQKIKKLNFGWIGVRLYSSLFGKTIPPLNEETLSPHLHHAPHVLDSIQ